MTRCKLNYTGVNRCFINMCICEKKIAFTLPVFYEARDTTFNTKESKKIIKRFTL